jgi:pimeloyl-ACP methyl ester carboxylesterase
VDWPEARPGRANHRRLPDVPTLLLAGDRDLSTPVEWAYQEAAQAPDHKVVVVKGANHSLQLFEIGTEGRRAVTDFLLR